MIRAHKILLYPNNKQETYFTKACGIARFAYNWGLSEWKEKFKAGEMVNEAKLRKALNAVKREKFPWMREVTKCVPQLAIKNDLNEAIMKFFEKKKGFPKFSKKGVNDSFSLSGIHFEIRESKVWIPLLGWVKMAEELRFDGKITDATISKTAGKWYISINVELPYTQAINTEEDEGISASSGGTSSIAVSDEVVVGLESINDKLKKKQKRLSLELSRRQGPEEGETKSENYKKTQRRYDRLQTRIENIRDNNTHQLSTRLAREYGVIRVKDADYRRTMSNRSMKRSAADENYLRLRRQLEYKAAVTGARIVPYMDKKG